MSPGRSCQSSAAAVAIIFLLIDEGVCISPKFIEEEKKPIYLNANVGESVVFTCDLDFPLGVITPYFLYYYKQTEIYCSLEFGPRCQASWFGEWEHTKHLAASLEQYTHTIGNRIVSYGDDEETSKEYAGRARLEVDGERAQLTLSPLRETDHGWYECRIYFPNRTPPTRLNGTWYHLTIHGQELLTVPPHNETVLEGQAVRLDCGTREPDARVTWYKDGTPLEAGPGRVVTAGGALVFQSAGVGDPGLYTCEVVSTTGMSQSASAFLDVRYKARVVYTDKEVFLPFGRPGILDCHISANPPMIKLRWEKDGFLFDPPNVPGVFNKRNGSLYFNKIEESHGGEYTCTPYNDLGTMGPSPGIRVVVQHPPVFTLTPHNMYLRRTGDTLIIPCDALDGDSTHRPSILWFKKDGSPLPDRASVSGGNLTINNIKESDRGLYQCVASNEAATISADTELLIEGSAQRGPTELVGNVTYTSVTLYWRAASPANSDQYSVWFRAADSPEWRTVRVTGDKATISSLDPGREYEFMVLVQTPNGDGLSSKPIKLKTKGRPVEPSTGVPIAGKNVFGDEERPTRIRVKPAEGGYLLEWEPPTSGQVEYYRLAWGEGSLDTQPVVIDTTDPSFMVGNLQEGGVYHFQVKAVTVNNSESSSDIFVLHVPQYQRGTVSYLVAGIIGFILATAAICAYTNRLYIHRLASTNKPS